MVPLENRYQALELCRQISLVIKNKLPEGWRVMSYGVAFQGDSVDITVVSDLNQVAPQLIHKVILNPKH